MVGRCECKMSSGTESFAVSSHARHRQRQEIDSTDAAFWCFCGVFGRHRAAITRGDAIYRCEAAECLGHRLELSRPGEALCAPDIVSYLARGHPDIVPHL